MSNNTSRYEIAQNAWVVFRHDDVEMDVFQRSATGAVYVQTIRFLFREDMDADEHYIANGYSPIEEGWEDCCGRRVYPTINGTRVEGC